MTVFDWVAAAVLGLSGLLGFARGATREITTVVALIVSVIAAVFCLHFTGPVARHLISTPWLANVAAVLGVFLVLYVILRLVGGALTRGVRATPLSGVDRGLGFGIGMVRGLFIIGVVALVMHAALPPERMPIWMTHAKLYPLADGAGAALRVVAPRGVAMAKEAAPNIEQVLGEAPPPPPPAPKRPRNHGYSQAQRQALDDLVEKSR